MSIVDQVKKISRGAIEVGKPVEVSHGTVSKINPLEVRVDQRLPLTRDFLIVPEQLTEYKLTIGGNEYVIRRGLQVGDKLLLLRVQGGQDYVIFDRVVS